MLGILPTCGRNSVPALFFALIAIAVFLAGTVPGLAGTGSKSVTSVRLHLPKGATPLVMRIGSILISRLREYSGTRAIISGAADLEVYLSIKPGIGAEGFRISDAPGAGISIAGNDERGLLYGVGKFLHTSGYGSTGFTASKWRGVSVPKKPVRGIYFATHFHNYYHEAPIEEVKRYVEDQALWGTNAVAVWFDLHQYNGYSDPDGQAMLVRLRALLKTAKDLDMDTGTGCSANEGFLNSPESMRADDSTVDHVGYHADQGPRIYNLGSEICPNKPGAKELLMQWNEEKFSAFKDVGLDYYWICAYDNGGCTCPKCEPWGSNGYLMMAEPIARAFHRYYPKGKVILSTWFFDRWGIGEWDGITEKFNKTRPDWVDFIMVGDYGDKFPEYPLVHGAPGGLPMLDFPEISMYLQSPWGGFGADPFPKYLQKLSDVTKGKLSGGVPYSEGIYEDMNKAICAQLYWDPDKPTMETVKEYVAFYFSPAVVEKVSRAVEILERNIERNRKDENGVTRFIMKNTDGAEEAYRLISEADAQLPARVKTSWRWRLIYLRASIDFELVKHQFRVSDRCEAAFRELESMYHAEHAISMVRPPVGVLGVVTSPSPASRP